MIDYNKGNALTFYQLSKRHLDYNLKYLQYLKLKVL